jgi:DNA modification methylase
MAYKLYLHDCLEWLDEQPEASFEAIITDPPYGLKEYSVEEQVKMLMPPLSELAAVSGKSRYGPLRAQLATALSHSDCTM